jgi:hypothetical protein
VSERARAVLYSHTFTATDNRRYVGLLAEPIEHRIEAALAEAHAAGREAGMREAVAWLRARRDKTPPDTLWHAAATLADQLENAAQITEHQDDPGAA